MVRVVSAGRACRAGRRAGTCAARRGARRAGGGADRRVVALPALGLVRAQHADLVDPPAGRSGRGVRAGSRRRVPVAGRMGRAPGWLRADARAAGPHGRAGDRAGAASGAVASALSATGLGRAAAGGGRGHRRERDAARAAAAGRWPPRCPRASRPSTPPRTGARMRCRPAACSWWGARSRAARSRRSCSPPAGAWWSPPAPCRASRAGTAAGTSSSGCADIGFLDHDRRPAAGPAHEGRAAADHLGRRALRAHAQPPAAGGGRGGADRSAGRVRRWRGAVRGRPGGQRARGRPVVGGDPRSPSTGPSRRAGWSLSRPDADPDPDDLHRWPTPTRSRGAPVAGPGARGDRDRHLGDRVPAGCRLDGAAVRVRATGRRSRTGRAAPVPGLWFLGIPWQRVRSSAIVAGADQDAAAVADEVVAQLG